MSCLKDVKAGDYVMWTSVNHKSRHALVASVGRKYIRIAGDHVGYDKETGRRNDNHGHEYLLTLEEHERRETLSQARQELHGFGVSIVYGEPAEKVLAIHQALKPLMDKEE